METKKWIVQVVDLDTGKVVVDAAEFEDRKKASAYIMRWNRQRGDKSYRARFVDPTEVR